MKRLVLKSIGSFVNTTARLFPKWNANFAFHLLCKVENIGIAKKHSHFFAKAQTVYLDIDGHSAALHQWGRGQKKVLFLHGWKSNSQRWFPYVSQLDLDEYTLYALDAPGHGFAKGKHLNIEIYRQALDQSAVVMGRIDTLVCHSLGSLVGSYAFLQNKSIPIERFVIMASPSGMDAIFIYFKSLLGLSKMAMQNLESKINTILKMPHSDISLANFFREVQKPVLVVHEVSDSVTPFDHIRVASEGNKRVETFFTTGQDHNLKGKETLEKVLQFIKQ